ncbi:MAG: hypothetical protein WBD20_17970 [Pirellulaceae bacterium]
MAKTLFKLIVLFVIGLLAYNFLFGTPEEKETSRKVVAQVSELSASVFDLLKSEKEKYDEGKYDEALFKLKSAIGIQQERATDLGHECLDDCEHLRQQEQKIEGRLSEIATTAGLSDDDRQAAYDAIRIEILELTRKTERLARELE